MRRRSWLRIGVFGLAVALGPSATTSPATAQTPSPSSDSPAVDPKLESALKKLAGWVRSERGQLSVSVRDVVSGEELLRHDGSALLNPASNAKLLTAAVALNELGPGYRYRTGLYGRIAGEKIERLVLRGHGDPSLGMRDVWRLGAALQARGVTEVGDIYVDQSRFDEQFVPPAFGQQPNEWAAFRAPVSAVAVDENAVTLNVTPNEKGQGARVWFEPPGFVIPSGVVATQKRGSGQAVTLSLAPAPGGRLSAKLGGHIAQGLTRLQVRRRVDDPRLLPGYALAHVLKSLGVRVTGKVQRGGKGEKRRITYVPSEALSVLIRRLGKNSDNFYAEMIFKTLAAEAEPERPATSARGAQVVIDWLKQVGAWQKGMRVENGSGLFDANRISASALTQALVAAHQDPRIGPDFLPHLAVGGVDGTLRSRFRRLRKERRVRAKTGTLAKADAISGYILRPGEKPLAFSVLVNGIANKHWAVRKQVDGFVAAVAR